jgi:hypothetical protein
MFNKAALLVVAALATGALASSANAQFRDRDWGGPHFRGDRDVEVRIHRDDDRIYRRHRGFRAYAFEPDCVMKKKVRFTPAGKVVRTVRVCR